MKRLIFLTILTLLINNVFSQTNFVWEKTDSIAKNKSQIYSDTKMFIAETWKSAKAVTENDDKENGNILIKGICRKSDTYSLAVYEYNFRYNVTFRMKDNKFKINIDNVYCESAHRGYEQIKKVDPFEGDNCPEMNSGWGEGLPKKKMILLMVSLKNELQSIIDNYSQYIKSPSKNNDDW